MSTPEGAHQRRQRLDWLTVLSAAVATTSLLNPTSAQAVSAVAPIANQAAPVCQPWSASQIYVAGDTATRNGLSYKANWWTQGDDPATHNGGPGSGQPWTQISSCGGTPPPPPPPAPCDPWKGTYTYPKGALAKEGSVGYEAQSQTLNQQPSTHNGPPGSGQPWSKTTKCDAPPPPPPPPPPGGLVFGSYKDITINLNWNTNELSTKVTGSLQPVLSVMPSRQRTATWAFATGECGAENWAGVTPAALVAANVSKWVAAGKKYIISTGGAAGSFSCGSDAGFEKFLATYNSSSFIGVDFDIEAGQSQAVIDGLVARVKAAQPKHPNLRFSFTLATLGGNSPQSLGDAGVRTMNSIKSQGLTKYIINLMTMDYGSTTPTNCVVENGRCNMGKSANQAAINLHNHWGVPYSQIEITPMIGGNDTIDETFTLADVDTVSNFVLANKLSGVHFWSLDRDNDCPPGWASPTCNTYGQAGTWGFTNRDNTKLGQ
jgi:chitinase